MAATGLLAASLVSVTATAAQADSSPSDPNEPASVSVDPLPTVQIDGVVWSQTVVGNTVYVGGSFTNARPAGSAAGVNTVPRSNFLAYNLTTGALITTFAPSFNSEVRSVVASADGTKLYVGGGFTTVSGVTRNRVAEFNLTTGALIASFAGSVNASIQSMALSSTTLYVGGTFTTAGGLARNHLAAFDATTGAALPWAPNASSGTVKALAVSPDGTKVAVGGAFTTLNGSSNPGYGLGMVSGQGTGQTTLTLKANSTIRDATSTSAILGLNTDGDSFYINGYDFGAGGNFEGTARATWADGTITWMEDCHGDTYSVFPSPSGLVYKSSHAHDCATVPGGFPDTTNPRIPHHGLAFTKAVEGTLKATTAGGYSSFTGQPAPLQVNWYPEFAVGTYTGQSQATWSVTGNANYVSYGGEFPKVNGKAQQGLVRFAVKSIAPNAYGPQLSGGSVTATSRTPGTVSLSFGANWDQDNETLTYQVFRNGSLIGSTTALSRFSNLPTITFQDSGLTPGATYSYQVKAVDPFGNSVNYASTSVTTDSGTALSSYATGVLASNPTHFWRLDETGTTSTDIANGQTLSTKTGVTRNVAGATTDGDKASSFNGSTSGYASTSTAETGPQRYSVEAWVKTTSTAGGKIIGFGSSATGNSSTVDRHLYLDASGKVNFGVYDGSNKVITSSSAINNGAWHQVVGTADATGIKLYVDGTLVAQRSDADSSRAGSGFWRVGGDTAWSGAAYLNGSIDEPAVYPNALTASDVANHYALGTGGGVVANQPPTASFTTSANNLAVSFDGSVSSDADGTVSTYGWAYGDGTSGTGVSSSHTYAAGGSYTATLTVTDNDGATNSTTRTFTVSAPVTNTPPVAAFTSSTSGLAATFNATSSSDADGTIASYAWNYGDGTTGTGVNSSHTYAASGTFTVTLTVTDNQGATGTKAQPVTVTAVVTPPGTAYATDAFGRTVSNGLGTADSGGAWTLSSTSSNYSVSGGVGRISTPTASGNVYAYLTSVSSTDTEVNATVAALSTPTGSGEYASVIGRRVGTDDYRARVGFLTDGRINVEVDHAGTALQTARVAGLTYTAGQQLQVRMQVVGTNPTTIQAKVWAVGGTEPTAWQVSKTDSTAALQAAGHIGIGNYLSSSTTTLPSVITFDNITAASTSGGVVTPPTNAAPVAAFSATPSNLVVSFDGSASTDSDGTISSYAWDYGDGTTGTGVTSSHTYAAAGTFTATLTVTDNGGATNTASKSVTVSAVVTPPAGGALAADAFSRTVANGLGTADTGGAWTLSTGAANYSVDGSVGRLSNSTVGSNVYAYLTSVSSTDTEITATVAALAAPAGSGEYASIIGRRVGTDDYRARIGFLTSGRINLEVDHAGTSLQAVRVAGITYNPGDLLNIRVQVFGTNPTTIQARVWAAGTAEPTTWQASKTDATAALQAAGHIGIGNYLATGSTALPSVLTFDNISAGPRP